MTDTLSAIDTTSLVPAVLASTIFSGFDSDTDISEEAALDDTRPSKRRKCQTGCQSIDDYVLNGGLSYGHGGLSVVAGNKDARRDAFIISLLSSHLLSSSNPPPLWIIDTTGTFSILSLAQTISIFARKQAAIQQEDTGNAHEKLATATEGDVEEVVERVLEQAKIMRVFDWEGLVEAVEEIEGFLMQAAGAAGGEDGKSAEGKGEGGQREEQGAGEGKRRGSSPETVEAAKKQRRRSHEVADSEDENEEEVMLFDELPATHVNVTHEPDREPPLVMRKLVDQESDSTGMIIVDNLYTIAAPLVRNPVHGQALITNMLGSLQRLGQTFSLSTILIDIMTTYTAKPTEGQARDSLSIFPDLEHERPALWKSVEHLIDVMLIHSSRQTSRREIVGRLEVVIDRHEGRLGRWGVFGLNPDGQMVGTVIP